MNLFKKVANIIRGKKPRVAYGNDLGIPDRKAELREGLDRVKISRPFQATTAYYTTPTNDTHQSQRANAIQFEHSHRNRPGTEAHRVPHANSGRHGRDHRGGVPPALPRPSRERYPIENQPRGYPSGTHPPPNAGTHARNTPRQERENRPTRAPAQANTSARHASSYARADARTTSSQAPQAHGRRNTQARVSTGARPLQNGGTSATHQVPQNLPTNAQAQVIPTNVSRGRQWSNFLSAAQPVPQSTIPSAPQPYALRSINHVPDSHVTLQHNSGQRADILNQTGLSSVPVRPAPSQPRLSERARGKQPEQPRAHRHGRPLPPIPTTQNWNARAAQDGYHGHRWQPAQAPGPSQSLAVLDTASTFQLTILSSRRGSSVATSDSSSEAVFKSPNSMSRYGGSPPASRPSSLAWTVPFRWTFLTGVRIEYPIFTKVALLILFKCPNLSNFTSMIGSDEGWTRGGITHATLETLSIKASDEPNSLFDNLILPNLKTFRLSWDSQKPHLFPRDLTFRRMIRRSECPLSTLTLVNICPREDDLIGTIGYVKGTLKKLAVRHPRGLLDQRPHSKWVTGKTLRALRSCERLEKLELSYCDTQDGELANLMLSFAYTRPPFRLLSSFWRDSTEHWHDLNALNHLRERGWLISGR